MKIEKEHYVLSFIFLLALGFRLFFDAQISFFSSDQAYFNLRHSEYLISNYFPIVYDSLSYGGNLILNTHVFHYFLGLWDLFLPQFFVYKVLPAILASSIVFIVYLLAKEITKNETAALFSAALSAFIPVYIATTLNQISTTSLSLPLFLLLLYTLLKIRTQKLSFLILSVVIILLEPLNLLMFFTFVMFIVLMLAESMEIRRDEREAIGLHLILFVLVNLILFKALYLEQGLAAVWQNLPLELYGALFQDFSLFQTVAVVGVIPLILGLIGFLSAGRKDKTMVLLASVLMADFTLLLLKLVEFEQGVLILAGIFCVAAARSIAQFLDYVQLTKVVKYVPYIMVTLVVISMASLIYPSTVQAMDVIDNGLSEGEVEALLWIEEKTAVGSVIAANVYEGNMIAYIANRVNVIDTQFFNAENRIFEVETIFTSESLVKVAVELHKYNVDYIYFSDKTKELYGVEELTYTTDETCFEEVFANEEAVVYRFLC